MAQAPLVIYIAKYSTILDDESRIKMTKKMPESDLQVFVSRNKEWPTYAKHDIRYDFTKPDNVLHICQIKIYPLNSRERFHQDEEWISVGLYSLQGLPDIAMIYGFGQKAEHAVRKQLILHFNQNPVARVASTTPKSRITTRTPKSQNQALSGAESPPMKEDIALAMKDMLQQDQATDKKSFRSSATKDFKLETERMIQKRIEYPNSEETLELIENLQKQVEAKRQRLLQV